MASKKISELTAAGALTGAELVELVQGGQNVKSTTQDIANLGGGGSGTVESVTGDGVDNTDPDNPVLTYPAPGDIGAEVAGAAATVATNLSNHISDATDAHAGTAITNTAAGNISATTVQAAINELDTEKQAVVNAAGAITDASTMDITAIKHTLTTSSATRTFTISYTGDDITLEVTLNTTASIFTFPATTLCVSEGAPSGDNTCSLAGASGDKYLIAIKKIGSNYRVVCKNFGQ